MSELEQTIEELEAEVLAELEEASDAQTKGATPAEPKKKIDAVTPGGEVDDGGAAVVDPEAKPLLQMLLQRKQKQLVVMHNRRALVNQTVIRSLLLVIHQKAKLLLKQNT